MASRAFSVTNWAGGGGISPHFAGVGQGSLRMKGDYAAADIGKFFRAQRGDHEKCLMDHASVFEVA